MSKKANSTAIGAFVVGAAALTVGGVAYFGSGRFLKQAETYVLFFQGSLKGLAVGSPVLWQGVKIGEVSDIVIRFHEDGLEMDIPVYIEYQPERVKGASEVQDRSSNMDRLIERGLRAQLAMQSFVTGMLAIELDFHPNTPVRLTGADPRYKELPTIPSMMEEITDTLGGFAKRLTDLPIEALVADLREAIQGANGLLRSPELAEAIQSLHEMLANFGKLARDVDDQVGPLSSSIIETAEAAQTALKTASEKIDSAEGALSDTLGSFKKLAEDTDAQINPLAASVTDTARVASAALEQARQTLATVQGVIAKDSELHYRLINALEEFAAAAQSIRVLTDYLEQHPEALLQGKRAPGGQ